MRSGPPGVIPFAAMDVAIADRFLPRELLGEGGLCTVHRAVDRQTGRMVVVKLVRPEVAAQDGMPQQILQGVRWGAELEHAAIAAVYDCGMHHRTGEVSRPWFTMELLEGPTLKSVVAYDAPMPGEVLLDTLRPVAEALGTAHAQGLVHRNLKPANVMFTGLPDQGGRPKLLDFCLAARTPARARRDKLAVLLGGRREVLGTPPYMAPEQFAGVPPAPSMDVWALAVVAFELLTRRQPFTGPLPALPRKIVEGSFDPLSPGERPGAARLNAFFARAFAGRPADRPPDAAALLAELAAALGAPPA